ncbi:MAG: polyprenol monophosphomannose synthase [Gammaproteobacteria bacterium]|nr:polyprenol monophosphomannose synthase [Gammaproteobacteria bacterium]
MEKVIIIIPTYNEIKNISVILDELKVVFSKIKNYDMGVLIFDSNSPDKTADIVLAYQKNAPNIYLQSEEKKSGLGSAYKKAMQYACDVLKADIVFEFDADGSHRPDYLFSMMEAFTQGADVVTGSRYVKGGSIPKDWALNRKLLSVFGNWAARIILNFKIKDYTTGFRGTRVSALKKINLATIKSTGYAYKIHLMRLLYLSKAIIVELPIAFVDRTEGVSKLPKNNVAESLLLLFYLRFQFIKYRMKTKKQAMTTRNVKC